MEHGLDNGSRMRGHEIGLRCPLSHAIGAPRYTAAADSRACTIQRAAASVLLIVQPRTSTRSTGCLVSVSPRGLSYRTSSFFSKLNGLRSISGLRGVIGSAKRPPSSVSSSSSGTAPFAGACVLTRATSSRLPIPASPVLSVPNPAGGATATGRFVPGLLVGASGLGVD